ncbi:MAG: hypothetical protein ACRDNK_10575 [Solirubrobacteraceae bacterium]
MATLKQKIRCERDARAFCEEYGLAEPDRIEYGFTCIRLFWEEPKTALVIDIDGPDALAEIAAEQEAALAAGRFEDDEEVEDDLD